MKAERKEKYGVRSQFWKDKRYATIDVSGWYRYKAIYTTRGEAIKIS